MIRRPPRSNRTDTLFPYTTLFRSADGKTALRIHRDAGTELIARGVIGIDRRDGGQWRAVGGIAAQDRAVRLLVASALRPDDGEIAGAISRHASLAGVAEIVGRSEDRRVGQGCVRTCRYRRSPYS